MITVGSVSREQATQWFDFLAPDYRGRRTAIRDLTHGIPEFVFWIYPDRRLYCREEALAGSGPAVGQLLDALEQMPMPIEDTALVISDNADIYGTVIDLWDRRYS